MDDDAAKVAHDLECGCAWTVLHWDDLLPLLGADGEEDEDD